MQMRNFPASRIVFLQSFAAKAALMKSAEAEAVKSPNYSPLARLFFLAEYLRCMKNDPYALTSDQYRFACQLEDRNEQSSRP
jgi:hypothetical protein